MFYCVYFGDDGSLFLLFLEFSHIQIGAGI